MAAEVLAQAGHGVTVYDAMPSAGRKFLMAGTWRAQSDAQRSAPAFSRPLRRGEGAFLGRRSKPWPPDNLREWSEALGQPTFVGSSGRVFPQAFQGPRHCCGRGCGGSTPWACNSPAASLDRLDENDRVLFQNSRWTTER